MKKLMMVILLSIPMVSFAKVSDFNEMITDNVKAQKQLHHAVQNNVDVVNIAVKDKGSQGVALVETGSESVNSPTRKDALIFEKEKYHPKKSNRAQFDRLANELNESNF